MKVILQGYLCDANFGDMLVAGFFYDRCKKAGFRSTDFFQYKNLGIGALAREQVGYKAVKSVFSCFCADAFVLISGGCFWNDGKNPMDAKTRYNRYIRPALIFQLLRKPVYVLGVGGGPVDTLWLREKMVKMLNKAKVVTFRDEETRKIFADYGVKDEAIVTADTALCITKPMLDEFEDKKGLESLAKGRKKLLLHIPDGGTAISQVSDKVIPAIIKFLKSNNDYFLVISNDNIRKIDAREKAEIKRLFSAFDTESIEYYKYTYHNCWQMCSFLSEMDTIVTAKLHVGVVGCALGKCVISFPVHREKTDNFYHRIGEERRCVNMRKLDVAVAYNQIVEFHDKPVHVSEEIRLKAESNLSVLDTIAATR